MYEKLPWTVKKKYNRKIDVTFLFLIRSLSYLELFTRMIFVSPDTFFRSLECRGAPRERFGCYGQRFIFVNFTCASFVVHHYGLIENAVEE